MTNRRPGFINLRARKIIRDMQVNKARFGLIILSIALGVFTVGALSRTQALVSRELAAAYAATNPAQAKLFFKETFDDDLVESIAALPEVEAAEGRLYQKIRVKSQTGQWETMLLYLRGDYDDLRIHKLWPEQGAWPPPKRTLLLERSSLNFLAARPGDSITLEMETGKQRQITIAGLAHDLEQVPTNFTNIAYGYVTPETYTWLLGRPVHYNTLLIRVSPEKVDEAHIRRVLAVVDAHLKDNGLFDYETNLPSGKHELDDVVQAVLFTLAAVGFLSLIFSTLLIANVISSVLTRQIAQIGVLKTLGLRSRLVMAMYLGMIGLAGTLAWLGAYPFTVLSGRLFTEFMAGLLNFDIWNFKTPLYVYGLELAAGLIIPLAAALYPIMTGARITVREAISQAGTGAGRFGLSRFDKLFRTVQGAPASFLYALRNLLRHKIRLAFTLLTLTLAGAVFIAVISARASLWLTIDNLAAYWQQDVTLLIDYQRLKKVKQAAMSVEGVVDVEGRLVTGGARRWPDGRETTQVIVHGIAPDSQFFEPVVVEGRWLQTEDAGGLVINLPLRRQEPDIEVGDTVEFEIEGRRIGGPVVGVVTGQALGGERFMDPILYLPYDYLARELGRVGQTNRAMIKTTDSSPVYQSRVAAAVDDHFRQIGIRTNQKQTNANRRRLIQNIFAVLLTMLFTLALLFLAAGGLSLTGMMSLSVRERTTEIGILRTIGGTSRFVTRIVMIEALFIGLFSWLSSVILALPLTRFLNTAVGNIILSTPLDHTFSAAGVVLWLATVALLSVLASLWPARNASRLSVRQALAYE